MTRFTEINDRLAGAALWMLGAANLLFLLLFIFVLGWAGKVTAAENTTCTGTDLVEQLARDEPAKLEAIRAEARETPNADSLLWRIEKNGVEPSFLLGTMHVADPRVVTLSAAAQDALDRSASVVIETTDILDPQRVLSTLAGHPDLTMFTDGTTLSSRLTENQRRDLEAGLAAKGLDLNSVNRMKPWMLASLLATPNCEIARRAKGEPVLDAKIAGEAQEAGKPVLGLETALDQFRAMASLPMDFHLEALVETAAMGNRLDDVTETMVSLYRRGEIGMVWAALEQAMPGASAQSYAEFEQVMVTARNHTMAERAGPILDKGSAFIAVGALHLPGTEGVVELLRQRGFEVEALR